MLVVDGPAPETLDTVIRSFEAQEIFRVVRFSENQGHGNARRESLRHCSHELVALADDLSLPDRFGKQLEKFCVEPTLNTVSENIAEFIGIPEQITGKRLAPETDGEIKEYDEKDLFCPAPSDAASEPGAGFGAGRTPALSVLCEADCSAGQTVTVEICADEIA